MKRQTLSLHLVCDAAQVAPCAAEIHTRLPPDQWETLVALAAEIVARHEAASTGSRVLVVPPGRLADSVTEALRAVSPAAAVR